MNPEQMKYCDQLAVALLQATNTAKNLTPEERDYLRQELQNASDDLNAVVKAMERRAA